MSTEIRSTFPLESDLTRRVHNLALGSRTPSNALIPLFEAIYNSLHAIQSKDPVNWLKSGRVLIEYNRSNGDNIDFVIEDNGEGLKDSNFRSFRTYDSGHKAYFGGKGVGRLTWLKVFSDAYIESVFEESGIYFRRSFKFVLDNSCPITDHKLEKIDPTQTGTRILLRGMRNSYKSHCPIKIETIIQKIVSHFIAFLAGENAIDIRFVSDDGTLELQSFLKEKCKNLGRATFEHNSYSFEIDHIAMSRSISEAGAIHKLFFAANGRIVAEEPITLPLGLSTYLEIDGQRYVYAGVVSGQTLDENVNSDRTSFDLSKEEFVAVKEQAIAAAKIALASHIGRVLNQQSTLLQAVVKKYPRFSYLIDDPREFVEKKIPRSFKSAEQFYQHLALYDFRENRKIERAVDEVMREPNGDDVETTISDKSREIVDRLTRQELSALADYTTRRKLIIDLLERRLGYVPGGTMRQHSEEALHSVICPLRVTKYDIAVDRHNLWILDDKLAYYEFWASDKKIKKKVTESDSELRPDVILFGGRTAFHRPGTDQPIVIVEFKRPARKDYDYEENPIMQIYDYIDELRGGTIHDHHGTIIDDIPSTKPFFCYVIADFTPKLRRYMNMTKINVALPGGGGYYGYNEEYNAFIQVLNYKYIVKDARLRNEAFFKHLGI